MIGVGAYRACQCVRVCKTYVYIYVCALTASFYFISPFIHIYFALSLALFLSYFLLTEANWKIQWKSSAAMWCGCWITENWEEIRVSWKKWKSNTCRQSHEFALCSHRIVDKLLNNVRLHTQLGALTHIQLFIAHLNLILLHLQCFTVSFLNYRYQFHIFKVQ